MIKIQVMNHDHLGKYISQIYRKLNSTLTKRFNNYGIGSGQYMFLIALYNKDGIMQEELSDQLNIDKGTTTRALKKLEEAGLIKRYRDEEDKRAYKVYLTDNAKKIKKDFFCVLQELEDKLVQGITKEEFEEVVRILKIICKNQCIK